MRVISVFIVLGCLTTRLYACEMPQYKIQNIVIQKLIDKYTSDPESPMESIRRFDFTGLTRVRLIYLAKGLQTKNEVLNFKVSKTCDIKFRKLVF